MNALKICCFVALAFVVSCKKKPLTLDAETSMKDFLKASDDDIKELVISEIQKHEKIPNEQIDVEYVLRDKENSAIVVKTKIK